MKKIICSLLSAVILISLTSIASAEKKFNDLDQAPWAEPSILEMTELDFISGYPDGSFKPNKNVTHLESIVLFSRAMGSTSEAMKKVIDFAVAEYGDIVDKYELAYGSKEVCFMLYRGVLTVGELDSYISKNTANTPLKRHEAAVIITKAMAAENEAKSELIIDLTYEDAKNIPAESIQYVYYVTRNNIMTGVNKIHFSPQGNVTRGQIAVMLSRVVDKLGISFIYTTLENIDTVNNIIITPDSGYSFSANTVISVDGKKASATSLPQDAEIILVLINDKLTFIDAYTPITTDANFIEGTLKEIHISTKPYIIVDVNGELQTFNLPKNIAPKVNGEIGSIYDLRLRNHVIISIENQAVSNLIATTI